MDLNRDLWAEAYRFYQEHAQQLERSNNDLTAYFCNLTQEISARALHASPEGKILLEAIYTMLEKRAGL